MVPVFQRIHDGGRKLLQTIQAAFGEDADPARDSGRVAFQANLRTFTLEISRNLTSLIDNPACRSEQTLADLNSISEAVRCLLDLAAKDGGCQGRS